MATSEVFRRGVEILRQRRLAEKAAAEQAAQAVAEAHHAEWLDRERAAAFLGISVHRLKRLIAAGTGPACFKQGPHKQSSVVWSLVELERWKADPRAYNAARAAQEGVDAPRHPSPDNETVPDRA